MSEELKPCPFCGEEAQCIKTSKRHLVFCENSRCCAEIIADLDCEIDPIKAWNTRAENTTLIEKLEGMKYVECSNELLPTSKSYNQALQDAIDLIKE